MSRFFKLIINIVVLAALLFISQQVWAQNWRPVRGGIPFGISGMALVGQQRNSLDFLIVHDNKQKNQGRLAIIRIKGKNQPEYFPLNWQNNIELPIDLEALTSIPGKINSSFIALSSSGKAYYIRLERSKQVISLIKEFNLPEIPQGSNFEAFALQNIEGKLVAVWAHRGEGEQPAIIYWGMLDLATYQIIPVGSANLKVPFPSGNIRHISDLKVDPAGIIYITSASDPGNDGPFQSGVYVAGYLGFRGNKIAWRQNPQLFPLYRCDYHKIEAIELVPGAEGGAIVATDDENLGSYVYILGGSS
ncbi:hypothetical protein ACF3DV_19155 [Chlorogloeopsis fritschii PCC 9212]|uniref:Glucose/Sorbosone dehydrogenase domain-containing protein n=1 Tax=Chlorogloeopsis fritschii PCC 6912 TaxID=211165 RepID=A0A3S0YCL4_CHLFR|nr:hypothetical protein [Chlorogloeopsis fritschii]MBF2007431.1 hypothetical protein [Chlorogloeopsis fritschii C42_A2020_084]RUR81708.1 hypothetical protein PCC6912_25770 [Chlorogloeopsis fritschii PCC 6912]